MDELRVEVLAQPETRADGVDVREVVFTINGQSLREHLTRRDLAGLSVQELPPSEHLVGRPLDHLTVDGRAALLVCPLCGDLGCGAILARIESDDDTVVWSDFIYGNNYDPEADDPIEARFVFDRDRYESALRHAAEGAGRL